MKLDKAMQDKYRRAQHRMSTEAQASGKRDRAWSHLYQWKYQKEKESTNKSTMKTKEEDKNPTYSNGYKYHPWTLWSYKHGDKWY